MITPLILAAYILVLICVTINLVAEYARDLMMMQQNSYRVDRYLRWLKSSGDTTSYQRLIGFCVAFLVLVAFTSQLWCMVFDSSGSGASMQADENRQCSRVLLWGRSQQ